MVAKAEVKNDIVRYSDLFNSYQSKTGSTKLSDSIELLNEFHKLLETMEDNKVNELYKDTISLIKDAQFVILRELEELVSAYPNNTQLLDQLSNKKELLEAGKKYALFQPEDIAVLIEDFCKLRDEEIRLAQLTSELAQAEEEYNLQKEIVQTTYKGKKELPAAPIEPPLSGFLKELEAIIERRNSILRTKERSFATLNSQVSQDAERIQTQIEVTKAAMLQLKAINVELSQFRVEKLEPAIDDVLRERKEVPASLQNKLDSVKVLIDTIEENNAYKDSLGTEIEAAKLQVGKIGKLAELAINNYKSHPASLYKGQIKDHLQSLNTAEKSLREGVEKTNTSFIKRLSELKPSIQQLQNITENSLFNHREEFARFASTKARFAALVESTTGPLTEIFKLDFAELERVEMEVEGQQQRAETLIQEVLKDELQSIDNLVNDIKKIKAYKDDELLRGELRETKRQINNLKPLIYGDAQQAIPGDNLERLEQLQRLELNLNGRVAAINRSFKLRILELNKRLEELLEGKHADACKILEEQLVLLIPVDINNVFPIDNDALNTIEEKIELIQKIESLEKQLHALFNQDKQVEEVKRLQGQLTRIMKLDKDAKVVSVDTKQLETINQEIDLIEQGVNLKDIRVRKVIELKEKSREVEIFRDMIKAIVDQIADTAPENPVYEILNTIRLNLTNTLTGYLQPESTAKPVEFVQQSIKAISDTLDKDSNLHNLSAKEASTLRICLSTILQPLNLLIQKLWSGETYRPRFFAKDPEIKIAQAAEQAHKSLKNLEQQLEQISERQNDTDVKISASGNH